MLDKDQRPVLPGDICIVTDATGHAYVGTALGEFGGRILVRIDRQDGELLDGAFPPQRVQAVSRSEPPAKEQVRMPSAIVLDFSKK
jgi:hypothetical protein